MAASEKIIITKSGKEVPRSSCRRIDGEYYLIGDNKVKDSGECYKINGRYYRVETGYIVYDEMQKEYVTNNDSIVEGIVGIKGKEFIYGSFSKNELYNVPLTLLNGTTIMVMKKEIIPFHSGYKYHKSKDQFFHKSKYKATSFIKLPELNNSLKYNLPYNCDGLIVPFTKQFNNTELSISPSIAEMAKELKGLTYGFEFETVAGSIPKRISHNTGLIALRDGSISGLEYATIPLKGEKGLAATKFICESLNTYTKYDEQCSLHLHIGGMPRTKEFLLALTKVLCLIQDEIYSLFPLYKKYNFGVKRKNYTKPLPALTLLGKMDKTITPENVDKNFDVLYEFLSMGMRLGDTNLDDVTSHPSDPRGRSKWNIRTRYHWVNLIPIIFGNKQTVEFRIHTPTTDYNKVISYLLLCGGIINYTKNNVSQILRGDIYNLSLSDIIYSSYPSKYSETLQSYITSRRDYTYSQNRDGNIKGEETEIPSINLFRTRKTRTNMIEELYRMSSSGEMPPPPSWDIG
jgi:hypothetical protein